MFCRVSIQLEVFKEDQTPENGTEVYSKAEAEIAEPKPILRKRPKQKRPVPAVRIRNASKSYGSGKPVLDKLEMNVPRGTMSVNQNKCVHPENKTYYL